jgi:hypothetical protein
MFSSQSDFFRASAGSGALSISMKNGIHTLFKCLAPSIRTTDCPALRRTCGSP